MAGNRGIFAGRYFGGYFGKRKAGETAEGGDAVTDEASALYVKADAIKERQPKPAE